jgi:hypothetical protein
MDNLTLAAKLPLLAMWALFVVAVLLLDWGTASRLYYAINFVGFVGFASGVGWFLMNGRWRYACLSVSTLLLLLYVVQWLIQVEELYSADSESGVGTALYRLVQAWGILFAFHSERFGIPWAVLAAYWEPLMALLQLLVIAFLVRTRRNAYFTDAGR